MDAREALGLRKPKSLPAYRIHPLRKVRIDRDPSEISGTFGVLTAGMFRCYTLEREWKDNATNISCIPVGIYECAIINSPRFGAVYTVKDVPGRDHILIHKGNLAGSPPLKANIEGCILVGNAIGELAGQRALLNSMDAFNRFMADLEGEPFTLEIRWND